MIALSDAALARVVIAATAVPSHKRRAWLVDIAMRLEGLTPAPPDARQRKARKLRKTGLVVMRIECHEDDTAKALIVSERLTEAETQRRALVEAAHFATVGPVLGRAKFLRPDALDLVGRIELLDRASKFSRSKIIRRKAS
jgi:hypothetical protein